MSVNLDGTDAEVNTAYIQARSGLGIPSVINTAMIQPERSEDEESDHTPDPYTSQMRGRVSPSPYTANTERARQFNSYVRGIIEQKLDVLTPISHQPRDLISDIITNASAKFPEFASCVRKRIRTFLKSYRRSRKLKDGSIPTSNGINKMDAGSHSPTPDHTSQGPSLNTAVVTIIADTPHSSVEEDVLPPEPKRVRMSPSSLQAHGKPIINSAGIMAAAAAAAATSNAAASNSQGLSSHEVQAVRQLITGYRESAAFLQRAADQLEAMLQNNSST